MKIIKAFIHDMIISFVINKVFSTHNLIVCLLTIYLATLLPNQKTCLISARFLIKICTTSFLQNFLYKILYLILVYVCPFID